MRKIFQQILEKYIEMYNSPYKPSAYGLAESIENKFPSLISEQLNTDIYMVKGSVGQGRWTDTPWIGIFDKEITNTAQKGFYIVYLFRKDMKGVYLSLNQGTKYIRQKYKGQKPKDKMRIIANNIRKNLIYDKYIFPLDRIDLATSTDNGTNYMSAHICGKYYPLSNFPSNNQLVKDLQEMIMLYTQLKTAMAGKTVEEMLNFYLQEEEIEDLQFQNDILVAPAAHTPRKPQPVPPRSSLIERQIWRRNASIAREALQEANYLCEIDNNHVTFKSNITNENFVEAHHLIPIKFQNYFLWSLDVPGNIVSLCPNCHRKIHHANKKEQKTILKILYNKYKNSLSHYDLLVPLDKIYKFYEN